MDEKEEQKLFDEYVKDGDCFQEHFDELAEKYEGKLVVVKNRKVIDSDGDVDILCKRLRDKGENPAMLFIGTILPEGTVIPSIPHRR